MDEVVRLGRLFNRCRSCRGRCEWIFSPCARVQRNCRIQGRARITIDVRSGKAYMHLTPVVKYVVKAEVTKEPSTVIVESEQQIPEKKCVVCTFNRYCDLKEYVGYKGCKEFDYDEQVKVEVVSYKTKVKFEVVTSEVSEDDVRKVKLLIKDLAKTCINCRDEHCKQLPLHVEITAAGTRFYKRSPHVRCPYEDIDEFDAVRYFELRLENLYRVPEKAPDHFSDQMVAEVDENGIWTRIEFQRCTM